MTPTKRRKRKITRHKRSQAGRLMRVQSHNATQLANTMKLIHDKYGDDATFVSHEGRKVRFTLDKRPLAHISKRDGSVPAQHKPDYALALRNTLLRRRSAEVHGDVR